VIETRISPVHSAVANLTGLRYACLPVVRIRGALIILQVAGHASGVGQVVVSVDVALRAGRSSMRTSEWEPGVGMVEAGICPRSGVVAGGACGRDASLRVIRIGCALVILHVARSTVRVGQIKVSVDMALRTLQSGVCSRQRESHQAVIKTRRLPGAGAVASLTGLRKIQTHMARVRRFAEIRQMAADAIRGRAFEFPSDVAS